MGLLQFRTLFLCLCLFVRLKSSTSSSQYKGKIYPGFKASYMDYIDQKGIFLLSNNSTFGFCFYGAVEPQYFVLLVVHLKSAKVVWTANRGLLISNSDQFVFDKTGNVYLQRGDGRAWSTDTANQAVDSMELLDSGNLMLLGANKTVLWQSFSHPTDTLLPGQEFIDGMMLKSFPKNNLNNYLQIKSGDLILFAGYNTPQIYWSLANDTRKTNNSVHGKVHSLVLVSNSWNFYDGNRVLLWQFIFSENPNPNATWAVVLDSDGAIGFYNLDRGTSVVAEPTKIPRNSCSVPEPCDRYYVCYFDNWCQCPNAELNTKYGCKPPVASTCNSSEASVELLQVGKKLNYFALEFVPPSLRSSNLSSCKNACLGNCSCIVLFFEESSGTCFLFDQVGSLTRSQDGSPGYVSYMKVSTSEGSSGKGGNGRNEALIIAAIVVATIVAISIFLCLGKWYHSRGKDFLEFPEQNLEDDDVFNSISGMPTRFTLRDLSRATKNFSMKIGQGGFGSVYLGVLQDGTRVAVKKLEGVGQGKKEFRAEVSIIGSIHHVHLVKLKGFCAEGSYRLLVYEFLGKGSLDKWIFKGDEESLLLDWDTRYSVAIGMAKGLAYLHEECEVKIVHCDIKPENVLLDDNFTAKVSDFGLAKLMNRDDSLVYTTVRGTRGYLAPEWITHNPISEKSDVYSYGIVLLEIIGGRKNYDSSEGSEKTHFPSYSCKMMEEGRLREIVDPKLGMNENDERFERFVVALKVAMWCIQEDMQRRPSMSRVVQMLEGLCDVPDPPISYQSRSVSSYAKWNSRESSSLGVIDDNSDAFISDVRLSGPR